MSYKFTFKLNKVLSIFFISLSIKDCNCDNFCFLFMLVKTIFFSDYKLLIKEGK